MYIHSSVEYVCLGIHSSVEYDTMLLRRPAQVTLMSHNRQTTAFQALGVRCAESTSFAVAHEKRVGEKSRNYARTSDNDVSSLRVVVWGGSTRSNGGKGRGARR